MYSLRELAVRKINTEKIPIKNNVPDEIEEYVNYSNKVSQIDNEYNLFKLRSKVRNLLNIRNYIKYDLLISKYIELINRKKKFKAIVLIDEMLKYAFVNKNLTILEKMIIKCPEMNQLIQKACAKKKYDIDFREYVSKVLI